jgi:hypothetical protein
MSFQAHPINPIAFSVKGAVAASGLSRSRIYEFISAGKLEIRKDGAKTLIMADSLWACINSLPSK